MSNFLPIPAKRAASIPTLPQHLLAYISEHFRDTHPDAFKKDVESLVRLRKEFVEPKPEPHPSIAQGLMRYHAQVAFLCTKFPSNISLMVSYHLPFPPVFSLTPDAPISLPSLTFERASVLFNVASVYASMAAAERRAEAEGIKRALGYLTAAAGVLDHLVKAILPTLLTELSTAGAAGYDMTESFLTTMREFLLAEAQECYWQQAVLQGTYKNGLIGKLAMKVSDYYKSALTAANSADAPSAGFFPPNWMSHITVKQMHFEAAAQFRLSIDDLEKSRYGEEIARLRVAEGLTKKGLDAGKRGVAESVLSDLKNLQAAVKSALERAVRDNDLVYVQPIPPATQLAPIVGAGMVKLQVPKEVAEPIAWLMGKDSGMEPLFSQLVPYGVHLALSIYDDRKDTLVRELDGKREELDGVAASTLQSLNLPGSIQALERPVGLPPSLLKKAEEVDAAGGTNRIKHLLAEAGRLSRVNANMLSESLDILDQEASENEDLVARQPNLANTRPPSHIANAHLITTANSYDGTLKQAGGSDETVRAKWAEWQKRIEILAGGEDDINDHVPTTSLTHMTLPPSVRPLRASLEQLDDLIAHRATLVSEAKQINKNDDIRPKVLQEATKLAHGGSGDVKTEWFEGLFEESLRKYDEVKGDMDREVERQEGLLTQIRDQNMAFLAERKDDPRVREREHSLQEMDLAYWKWRELIDNAEEGIKFHNGFAEILGGFKSACVQFLNSRRADVGQITHALQNTSLSQGSNSQDSYPSSQDSYPHQQSSPPLPSPRHMSPPPQQPPQFYSSPPAGFSLPHPNASSWTSGSDLLPPPPPQPILRSGGVPTQQSRTPQMETPRRMTRSQAAAGGTPAGTPAGTPRAGRKDIGDAERNPYSGGRRKDGGGVV